MTATTKTQATVVGKDPPLRRYMDVILGHRSWAKLIYFEFCTIMGAIPGTAGLFLRKLFWPRLFRSCGSGTVFGANVLLRHPGRIDIGERVVVSDGCILDARHDEAERAIVLGNDVMLSNFVIISCKGGTVELDAGVGLGAQAIIQAVNDCRVTIGEGTMVGPRCFIVGGRNYNLEYTEKPMLQQGLRDNEVDTSKNLARIIHGRPGNGLASVA
jgi:galactoside O-acetyltransferase